MCELVEKNSNVGNLKSSGKKPDIHYLKDLFIEGVGYHNFRPTPLEIVYTKKLQI